MLNRIKNLSQNFFSSENKIFYISLFLYCISLTMILYLFTNTLRYETIVAIYNSSLHIALFTLSFVLVSALSYYIVNYFNIYEKFKYKFYQVFFNIFDKSSQPVIILDKDLNIVFCNQHAKSDFKLYNKKIKAVINNFDYRLLHSGKFNFNSLNPRKNNLHSLSVDLNAIYTNRFTYNNLDLCFTSRVFTILNKKMGLIVEFNFKNRVVTKPNILDKIIPKYDISEDPILLENMRLKMINLMLHDRNNPEYLDLYNKIDKMIDFNKATAVSHA